MLRRRALSKWVQLCMLRFAYLGPNLSKWAVNTATKDLNYEIQNFMLIFHYRTLYQPERVVPDQGLAFLAFLWHKLDSAYGPWLYGLFQVTTRGGTTRTAPGSSRLCVWCWRTKEPSWSCNIWWHRSTGWWPTTSSPALTRSGRVAANRCHLWSPCSHDMSTSSPRKTLLAVNVTRGYTLDDGPSRWFVPWTTL